MSQPEPTVPATLKIPTSESNEAATVTGMPWSCAAGSKCVHITPFVDAPHTAKVPVSSQNGPVRAARASVRSTRRALPGATLPELAARDAMSVRTYSRRFRQETGLTPVQWLTQRRVDRARQLLEETDHTVDRIAAQAGFGTGASLRQHFHAALGVSPGAYRSTFRGTRSVQGGDVGS